MTLSLKKVRALGLSSGGLDSILSALILRDQGIEVEWISFETPFFSSAKARQAAAGTIMKNKGFDFVFSGEVLGQRPMSQTKPSLRYVEKHSDIDGYILRPLTQGSFGTPEHIHRKRTASVEVWQTSSF